MVGIIHNDFSEIDQEFKSEFNVILSNLRISIFNYLSELINIEVPKFKKDAEITPKGGTGYGVRLLNQLVEDYYE